MSGLHEQALERRERQIRARDERVEAGRRLLDANISRSGAPCPPHAEDPFPTQKNDIPAVSVDRLDGPTLAGAIRHHGALIVRGLMQADLAADMRVGIDRVLEDFEQHGYFQKKHEMRNAGAAPNENVWFAPLRPEALKEVKAGAIEMARGTGSVWTLLSPYMTDRLFRFFDDRNLKPLLTDYFDDDPNISFLKSVLRRVAPLPHGQEWHQDGAFMTPDIKSLNLWIALSDCGPGAQSPGMDLVPKRLNSILDVTGKNGAIFDWSVSQKSVDTLFADSPPVRPTFRVGDAIFFDHFNLHATSADDVFTQNRYAIETWFFASGYNAPNQMPVAW